MKLLNSRSKSGSLFRSRSLSGFLKVLLKRKEKSDTTPTTGNVTNRMSVKYSVKNDI